MKKVCAWCKKELGVDEEFASQGTITHGICSLCALRLTQDVQRSAQQILDYLEEPVLIVDSDGAIKGANNNGLKILDTKEVSIENELIGDAFECSHSKTSGGCGRTVHCTTCTIRNIITDTLKTGKNYEKVPAFQLVDTSAGPIFCRYLLSTERVNNRILIRIDEVTKNKNE